MPSRYLTVEELLALRGEAELLRLAGPGGGPPFPSLVAAIGPTGPGLRLQDLEGW